MTLCTWLELHTVTATVARVELHAVDVADPLSEERHLTEVGVRRQQNATTADCYVHDVILSKCNGTDLHNMSSAVKNTRLLKLRLDCCILLTLDGSPPTVGCGCDVTASDVLFMQTTLAYGSEFWPVLIQQIKSDFTIRLTGFTTLVPLGVCSGRLSLRSMFADQMRLGDPCSLQNILL